MSVAIGPGEDEDLLAAKWTMTDVIAGSIKYTVVAAKKPGEYIVRGIKKWSTPEATRQRMEPYLAIDSATGDIEWTYHEYLIPHYLEYGSGDLPRRVLATDGIYIFRIHCQTPTCDSYGPAQRIEAW